MPALVRCFVALGANLGQAQTQVEQAAQSVASLGCNALVSALYVSPPWQADGPDYVNAVLRLDTHLAAPDLLQALQAIEQRAGRVRSYTNAPRTLDVDLLLYGHGRIDSPHLTVPHPRMWERAFVVLPLRDVAPELVSQQQLQAVAAQAIRLLR